MGTSHARVRLARQVAGAVFDGGDATAAAPLSGSSPGVGVFGHTLGGGTGRLARRHGVAGGAR